MNQNIVRLIIEKVIATALIILGSFLLYKIITGLHHTIELVHSEGIKISVYKIFKNYHFQLIVPMLTIVSGIFMILGKRIGWIGSVTMTFVLGIAGLVFLLKSYFLKTIYYEATILELLLFILSLIVFFSLGLLLLKKDYINKYRPTNKTWIIIILVIIILSIDRILIN